MQPQLQPQLRLVSVLFLDVAGSTALSETLDPEDISELMDGLLARCTQQVQAHGGRVLQYAGDNLLAAFGADAVQEDDAARAVRAGLALLAEGRSSAQAVRVGIHTGGVLLGAGVDGDGSIRGLAVNIAARMEQSAPVGALRISQDTWRQVQGQFDVQEQPPLQVKGVSQPLRTWLVSGERHGASRRHGVEGLSAPLLGRQADWQLLDQALNRVQVERRSRAVTLLADAGVGKSRLLQDWLAAAAPTGVVLQARLQPGARLQPHALLRAWLMGWLQIADSDDGLSAGQRFVQGLSPLLPGDDGSSLALLGRLIGLETGLESGPNIAPDASGATPLASLSPRALYDGALLAWRRLLAAWAAQGPVPVLLADDIHWADEASLDLLQQLTQAPHPMLLVMAARPALLEHRPAWGATEDSNAGHQVLHMAALDSLDAQRMAQSLLHGVQGDSAELAALQALLVHESEGNPFYLEELLQMLIDDGLVVATASGWQLQGGRVAQLRVPATLTGVLQARLDSLVLPDRQALQDASVIGPVFWADALATLNAQAPQSLPTLDRKALVRGETSSTFDDTSEHRFVHHLLHQVTYDTVLKAQRRAGHAQAARWLAQRMAGRAGEHLASTAEHFLRAGEDGEALHWLLAAAEHALARFDNVTTLAQVRRALPVAAGAAPEQRWRLLILGLKASHVLMDRQAAEEFTLGLEALAGAPGAPAAWRPRADYWRSVVLERRCEYAAGCELAERAVTQAVALAAHDEVLDLRNALVHFNRLLGRLEPARHHAALGLALAQQTGNRLIELRLRLNLAVMDYTRNRPAQALAGFVQCLAAAKAQHDVLVVPMLHVNLATCCANLGAYDVALVYAEQALASALALNDPLNQRTGLVNRAEALLGLQRGDEARTTLQDVLARPIEGLTLHFACIAWVVLGEVELDAGRGDAAAAAYEQSRQLALGLDDADAQLDAIAGVASAELLLGQPARALETVAPVLRRLDAQAQRDASEDLPLSFVRWAWYTHCVLVANHHPRAGQCLSWAVQGVEQCASFIEEPAWRAQYKKRHHIASAVLRAAGARA